LAVTPQLLRLAAYGVCCDGDRILLARCVSPDPALRHWTLPGGKVEHAEDPYDAVVREVAEETGYTVEVENLLGVDSESWHVDWAGPAGGELHRVGIFYSVAIRGGELRHEIGGSTDLAAWIPVSDVAQLERTVTIDVALNLYGTKPANGHVAPVPVGGLLRY